MLIFSAYNNISNLHWLSNFESVDKDKSEDNGKEMAICNLDVLLDLVIYVSLHDILWGFHLLSVTFDRP